MPPKISKETEIRVIFPDSLDFQPRTSPCEAHCPAGNPIQKVHALLQENRVDEALAFLKARNPFPGITGRVCSHPCEQSCNRKHYDEAVSIRALERSAADRADLSSLSIPLKEKPSGKKLAIIGSGPAGMTCAYFSALLGHDVTVLESAPILGGVPRMAIPRFRLPHDVVDREIGQVLQLGVRALTNTEVGRDVRFEDLRAGFDAILIAAGRWREQRLELPGARLPLSGLKFMRDVNLGWKGPVGETVAIIGGGGVAFNCAFTARRLGASRIYILCVEPDGAMCAFEEDLRQAQAEGFHILNSRKVSRVDLNFGR
jgi:NADPH-dependent glutamate synthase beta subunit-like oxidoreductase